MNRITINRIITAADKQGQDTASHTYSADAFARMLVKWTTFDRGFTV